MIEDGYAICFNQWALDPRIKNEIQILLIISSLMAKTGVCFARNKYFADLFGEHEKSISRKIKKLADLGYIQITYTKRGCEVKERQIRVTKLLPDGPQNCYSTGNKIVEGNINIFKNNIFKNIGEPGKKEFQRTVYLDKKIQVGWDFKINFKDEYFEPYRNASKKLTKDIEQWIIKNKCGETVTKNFICRQLLNFAKKQGCVKQLAGEKE
jgi:uncharacterized protein YwgA